MNKLSEHQISLMDLRLLELQNRNKNNEKIDKYGASCPIVFRQKLFQRNEPNISFNTYSLACLQMKEKNFYIDRKVSMHTRFCRSRRLVFDY